jgi:hypothetical protein
MAGTQTHIFRASVRPKSRESEIPSSKSLYDLVAAIVCLFEFDSHQAFGFDSNLKRNIWHSAIKYELFADIGESNARSVKKSRIVNAFPSIDAMIFLYYGNEWHFRIEVIGLSGNEPRIKYPRLLKSVGAAPVQYPDWELAVPAAGFGAAFVSRTTCPGGHPGLNPDPLPKPNDRANKPPDAAAPPENTACNNGSPSSRPPMPPHAGTCINVAKAPPGSPISITCSKSP